MNLLAHAILLGVALTASLPALANCTKDTDCKGNRICVSGSCTDPAPRSTTSEPAPAPPQPLAAAPGPGAVKVAFLGDNGIFSLDVTAPGGAPQHCTTPCSLKISPGPARLDVTAPVEYSKEIEVPSHPSTITVARRRVGMLILGASFLGVGAIAAVGVLPIGLAVSCQKDCGKDSGGTAVAVAGGLAAVAFLGTGLPLFFLGLRDKRVAVSEDDYSVVEPDPELDGVRLVSVGLAPTGDRGFSAGLTLSF